MLQEIEQRVPGFARFAHTVYGQALWLRSAGETVMESADGTHQGDSLFNLLWIVLSTSATGM